MGNGVSPIDTDDDLTQVQVDECTFPMRIYKGKVLNNADPDNKGKILLQVPDLGWNDNQIGAWAFPRQTNGLIIPDRNQWVDVFFENNSFDNPRYGGIASDMDGMLPLHFDGMPTTQVIWENPKKGSDADSTEVMKFDANIGKFELLIPDGEINIDGATINIGENATAIKLAGGGEKFVLGDTAKTEWEKDTTGLSTLQSAISGWTPVPNDGGAALKTALAGFLALTFADYSNSLSTKIEGA